MKGNSSSAAAYVPPPAVIEVASTNWKDDYLTKLAEYEDLGVSEYIIVDYAAYGGIRFIAILILVRYTQLSYCSPFPVPCSLKPKVYVPHKSEKRYIGSPKQPTITIYQLEKGEYLPAKIFRGQDRIESRLFPNLTLTAEQIFAMSR